MATVVPARGAHVEGLLYRLGPADLRALDGYEGHPFVYERVSMLVKDEHGRRRRAQVYLQPADRFTPSAPPPGCARVLCRAYRRLGFDAAQLAARPRGPSDRAHGPTERTLEPAASTLVFVYGTLLAGESNHRYLARARLVAETRTPPAFSLHDLGAYPGLVPGGDHAVAGEAYEVDARTLAALDHLESHPRFYRRTHIVVENGAAAQTYLLTAAQVAGHPIIASGSWRARRKDTRP